MELRALDPRRRRLLELFRGQDSATAVEISRHLGLRPRTVVGLCRVWLAEGFFELADASRKNRAYRLAVAFERLAQNGQSK